MSFPLTTLTPAEASDLARIAGAAVIRFQNVADAARTVIRANGPGHWRDQHEAELAEAVRLQEAARRLETAALKREREAGREEAVGVRMIEALAQVAMRPLMARAA